MNLMSIVDAAELMELSPARVRLLASSGELPAEKIGGRWLVERGALERRRRRGSAGGRRFIPSNAWAVLGLASGEEVAGLDPAARWRLRRALSLEGLRALAPRLEHRAKVARYSAHTGEISHLLADHRLVASGVSAAGELDLDLVAGREADGYVSASARAKIVEEHALSPAAIGEENVVLRVVPDDVWELFLADRSHAPAAAVALDLLDESDPRSRAAGEALLAKLDRKAR